MGFKCGIVGLPNVGKSTLFNALTQTAAAQAANYPFCTIEPNTGLVGVPDERLDVLAQIAPRDRWRIVAYIKALQLSQPTVGEAAPGAPGASAPAGQQPGGEPPKPAGQPPAGRGGH